MCYMDHQYSKMQVEFYSQKKLMMYLIINNWIASDWFLVSRITIIKTDPESYILVKIVVQN
jgi:hypothetical protein